MTCEPTADTNETVIPLLSEDVSIERRHSESKVVVGIKTFTTEQVIDDSLHRQSVEVERRPIGRIVDAVPPVREDGDTTVIPVVEEVLVVERRLVLKEEIYVRRVNSTERFHQVVTLREQRATIERTGPDSRTTNLVVEDKLI